MQEHHIDDEGIVDLDEVPDLAEPLSGGKKGKKKRDSTTLRKAPQAPKRFKSSYICFFMAKQPEIKAELGEDATVTSISKRSAEMWKHLPPEERAHWDDVAAKLALERAAERLDLGGWGCFGGPDGFGERGTGALF